MTLALMAIRLVTVGGDFVGIAAGDNLGNDHASTFVAAGFNGLDAVDAAHGIFNGQNDPLFDLFRAGAGVGDVDGDDVGIEFGEDFLLDAAANNPAANQ